MTLLTYSRYCVKCGILYLKTPDWKHYECFLCRAKRLAKKSKEGSPSTTA